MKLLGIRLCNFRQFYGKTPEIILATGEQNTTVIHGNNGAGKTTLLNAFTWVLYEKFTAAFAAPDRLVNTRAINEAKIGTSVDCHVEIKFEHDNKQYQVKRQCYVFRDQDDRLQSGQNKLFMQVAGDDGRWSIPVEQPDDIIGRILPESLHQYFFFDGERIDHIFRSEKRGNIAEDTKELLGVKVLDRSIEHLKKAKRHFQEELKEIGDVEIKTILKEQVNLEKERDRLGQRQQEISQALTHLEEVKQKINNHLLELSGATELKRSKLQLEAREKSLRTNLLEAKINLKNRISSSGYLVFTPPLLSKFRVLVQDLRAKGELPAGIKQHFVESLLQDNKCICGTNLETGTIPYQNVQNWLTKAGMGDLDEAAIRLETQGEELEKQIPEFWLQVDNLQAQIGQWRLELSQVENDLDKVKEKLRNYPDVDIQQLQKDLDQTEREIKELTLEQGENKQSLEQVEKEIGNKEKQVHKYKVKEGKQGLAQRRMKATEEAIERIIEVRSRLEKQFRFSLEKRLQEIFSTISFTPYIPRLSNEYELTLVENTSGIAIPVAASTGENQILSLSFIGGIIDRVREWSQKNTLIGLDSSTFPIVMDSPFGSLDEIYRRRVALAIPQIANQLMILVTKTQWRGEVEEELQPYLGKEYVLVYYSPKPDCEQDSIEINGISYPLVCPSPTNFEYTEIMEIKG